jgi:hypothetical protein
MHLLVSSKTTTPRGARKQRRAASALMLTLLMSAILVTTLGGFLWLVRSQNLLVAESQAWNAALAAAEAGVEEGLAQLNVSFGTDYNSSLRANWPFQENGTYGPRTGLLANATYSVVLLPGSPGPSITATGSVIVPILSRTVTRVVHVTTAPAPAFPFGLGVQQGISCAGNSFSSDSYDSSDPGRSTNGRYDHAKRTAGGDVAGASGLSNVRDGPRIRGRLFTGPDAFPDIGSHGVIGDLGFAGPGIQPGWYASDLNVEFKPVAPPESSRFVEPAGSGTNRYVLSNGGYVLAGDLILRSGETLLVSGDSTLLVRGSVAMAPATSEASKDAWIRISPGGRLKLFVAGASASLTRVDIPGTADAFQYFGLPSNTNLIWSANTNYAAAIYAPQALVSLAGDHSNLFDSRASCDFQGACIARSVTLNARFSVHFDEALKRAGPMVGFVVTSWREL